MTRTALLLGAALLLGPAAAWSQQTTSEQPLTPQQQQTPARRRARRGGRAVSSTEGEDGGGLRAMKELPCPRGFTAQVDSGPHLVTSDAATRGKGRKAIASTPAKKTLARRCVPIAPKKTAADPVKVTPQTQ